MDFNFVKVKKASGSNIVRNGFIALSLFIVAVFLIYFINLNGNYGCNTEEIELSTNEYDIINGVPLHLLKVDNRKENVVLEVGTTRKEITFEKLGDLREFQGLELTLKSIGFNSDQRYVDLLVSYC